ncbi:NAD(P)/FAD-dependent oxidoreductase [Gordonia sp. MP11Mi]|uniref:NADH dehydrogenase-like protein YjlD n=1 Tax=Gordonia sp. MP11Mi TaxID=3022769 RepID=A0AA97CWP6_9ACTN
MKIIVVGAGYAGTIAANKLAKKLKDAEIVMVNPRPDFVERVRLHQHIAGTESATTPLDQMLRDNVSVTVGSVEAVGDGTVRIDDGTSLDFDYLIVAVGSTVAPPPGTVAAGVLESAERARTSLADLPAGAVVTVVGGGPTGIETAAEVAEARPDLQTQLIAPSIGASLSPGAQQRVRTELERLNVQVTEGTATDVRASDRGGVVVLESGQELRTDLTLWAIIADVPDLIAASDLAADGEGRALVDEYLRSVTDPRVFVVGDCAAVPGARFACATATPQGAHAANTLIRIVKGRKMKPFSMGYTGQALSLGRRNGVLQLCRRDDTPRRLFISGRLGAVSKESINRYAKFGPRTTKYAWLPGRQT